MCASTQDADQSTEDTTLSAGGEALGYQPTLSGLWCERCMVTFVAFKLQRT